MNDTPTPRDCEHGQLSRSCEICELKRDLSAAQERVRELENTQRKFGIVQEELFRRAERAESALASEREARERAERAERERWIHHDTAIAIAQHLKPYLPINEDNVAEMLADIRMGLADRAAAIDSAIAQAEGEK